MRKLLIFLSLFLTTAVAWACGDKLMLVMRVRLAQLKLGHPVAILAYAQRDLPSSALVRQIQLQPAVKKAGHRFQFIDDTARLDDALKAEKYDLVLADSPPILLVTEARVMSEKFDATLAVIRAGKTTRTVLASLSSVLELSGSRAVGLVLNGVDTNSDEYFDAYGHDGKGEYLNA